MQNAQKGVRFYMGFLWRFSKRYWVIFGVSIGLTLLYATSNVYIMPLVQDLVREVSNKNLATFSNHVINAFLLFFYCFSMFFQYVLSCFYSISQAYSPKGPPHSITERLLIS